MGCYIQVASGALKVAADGGELSEAEAGPAAQAVFKTGAAAADSASEPPVPLQVFVGILGIAAVPVVSWSLYTLANTGKLIPTFQNHPDSGRPFLEVASLISRGNARVVASAGSI